MKFYDGDEKMKYLWMIVFAVSVYGYEIVINETISANNLQLTRDDTKEVVIDQNRKLMWQDDASVKTTTKDWSGAINYCDNLSFAGYSDWRLPSHTELLSIVDKTKYNPAIKTGFKNIASDFYWSSSPYVSGSSGAWVVNFYNGYDYGGPKSNSHLVRCVRDSK